MINGVFSLFDKKAQTFGALMFFSNDDLARRGCADTMRAGGDFPMINYPDDFAMYRVGTFNMASGEIVGHVPPVFICDLSEFVEK